MLRKIVNVFHFPFFKETAILNPIFCFSKYNTKVVNASKDSKRVSFSLFFFSFFFSSFFSFSFQSKRNLESNLLFLKVQYQATLMLQKIVNVFPFPFFFFFFPFFFSFLFFFSFSFLFLLLLSK